MAGAKTQREVGYLVEMQTRTTRTYGAQTLPTRIVVESAADLVFLAGKTEEFAAFVADVALIRAAQPLLEPLLQTQPLLVVEQHGSWPELLRVCAYFQASPRPQLFIRELPIAVHTKFIEQHAGALMHLLDVLLPPTAINSDARQFVQRYGLRSDAPLVRMRLLDARLRAQLGLPLADIAATTADLAALPAAGLRYVIVENKMVFLTLPPLADTIAIFGGGFQLSARTRLVAGGADLVLGRSRRAGLPDPRATARNLSTCGIADDGRHNIRCILGVCCGRNSVPRHRITAPHGRRAGAVCPSCAHKPAARAGTDQPRLRSTAHTRSRCATVTGHFSQIA